ncbi:MAG: hypothetical protein ACREC0_02840 [Methylocella sp.]
MQAARCLRQACESAGLAYFNPHSFRNTLAALGERLCTTPEAFTAWSQNLAHANVLTTFTSYGVVARGRQAAILNELGRTGSVKATSTEPDEGTVQKVIAHVLQKAS